MNIDKVIELDLIKEKWASLAMTQFAKDKIKDMKPFMSENDLRKSMRETSEGRLMIEQCGTPPLVSMEGVEDLFIMAQKGACLTVAQLESVEISLVAIKRLKKYLERGKDFNFSLAYDGEMLESLGEIREAIVTQIRNGAVDDRATPLLFDIRNDIRKMEDKIKSKIEGILSSNQAYMTDQFTTLRNGRWCLPVRKEYRNKIKGSLVDKSSSGNTLFIEPAAISKYYEQLQGLQIDEENELYRILYTLSDLVAGKAEQMFQNLKVIERMDYVFSKGKLSIDMEGVEPQINTNRVIEIVEGRHPLMAKESCVPIEFSIGGEHRGVIITGPNMGGKTVTIKTVALNCLMAQYGLHVTCQSANLCMNTNYLCDIGDGQNLAENLSTFSAHIENVMEILSELTSESLVIMDELGSGTDPTEGMGIAIAILEALRKSNCLFLVTTHYPEVKQYADQTEGVVNASMAFDRESLKPLFKIMIGESGDSCAFYVASRLGMSDEMLKTAIKASFGKVDIDQYSFLGEKIPPADQLSEKAGTSLSKPKPKIQKNKKNTQKSEWLSQQFKIGDSVLVLPDQKIGIVCEPINRKGVLRVQMRDKKIWINHKRVKLKVSASELYPDDYDFSIVFDSIEERKYRHKTNRKFTGEILTHDE